jgi:membrane protein DedA with SNARE-associated domain
MLQYQNMENRPDIPKASRIKKRLVPGIILLIVVLIIGSIFYISHYHPEKIQTLETYGYLGVFLISLLLNATVVLPAGNVLVMAAMAVALPPMCVGSLYLPAPFAVGIIGGLAAAIGESTGYIAGYSGQAIMENKHTLYERMSLWLKKWGTWLIVLFSAIPLIFDVVGLAAGALRFPFWKFLLASWLGRSVLYTVIAWAWVLGWEALLNFLA